MEFFDSLNKLNSDFELWEQYFLSDLVSPLLTDDATTIEFEVGKFLIDYFDNNISPLYYKDKKPLSTLSVTDFKKHFKKNLIETFSKTGKLLNKDLQLIIKNAGITFAKQLKIISQIEEKEAEIKERQRTTKLSYVREYALEEKYKQIKNLVKKDKNFAALIKQIRLEEMELYFGENKYKVLQNEKKRIELFIGEVESQINEEEKQVPYLEYEGKEYTNDLNKVIKGKTLLVTKKIRDKLNVVATEFNSEILNNENNIIRKKRTIALQKLKEKRDNWLREENQKQLDTSLRILKYMKEHQELNTNQCSEFYGIFQQKIWNFKKTGLKNKQYFKLCKIFRIREALYKFEEWEKQKQKVKNLEFECSKKIGGTKTEALKILGKEKKVLENLQQEFNIDALCEIKQFLDGRSNYFEPSREEWPINQKIHVVNWRDYNQHWARNKKNIIEDGSLLNARFCRKFINDYYSEVVPYENEYIKFCEKSKKDFGLEMSLEKAKRFYQNSYKTYYLAKSSPEAGEFLDLAEKCHQMINVLKQSELVRKYNTNKEKQKELIALKNSITKIENSKKEEESFSNIENRLKQYLTLGKSWLDGGKLKSQKYPLMEVQKKPANTAKNNSFVKKLSTSQKNPETESSETILRRLEKNMELLKANL